MPCSYDTSAEDRAKMIQDLDRMTVEADRLRELVIGLVNGSIQPKDVPSDIVKEIQRRQTAHRKEDLKRLEQVFIKNKDTERLALVWAAKPTKPLEPQLGFDPDSF